MCAAIGFSYCCAFFVHNDVRGDARSDVRSDAHSDIRSDARSDMRVGVCERRLQ